MQGSNGIRFCPSCVSANLIPDLRKLPVDCHERQESGLEELPGKSGLKGATYQINFDDLTSAASAECPWCTNILNRLKGFNVQCESVVVDKWYMCNNSPHEDHFTRMKTILWPMRLHDSGEMVSAGPTSFYFRIHWREVLARPKTLGQAVSVKAAIVRRWLGECDDAHDACGFDRKATIPTRVLDVSGAAAEDSIRLHISRDRQPGPYAALSYCWGGDKNILTTTENITECTRSIAICDLPETIRDAVLFTHALGIRYLWVDSLCILQDSEQDKRNEIRQMRRIFKNANVTLIAQKADRVDEGFLDPGPKSDALFEVPLEGTDGSIRRVYMEPTYFYYEDGGTLDRAWTLEERALSNRLVIFASCDMLWLCRSTNANTDPGLDPKTSVDDGKCFNFHGLYTEKVPDQWMDVAKDYKKRALTRPGDATVAIAGIAEEFAALWGKELGEYCAGIW